MIATQAGIGLKAIENQRDTETHRFEFDRGTAAPSMAVVAALSEVSETDPADLEPLYSTIDPDALDRLLQNTNGGKRFRCRHEGYSIAIDSDGVIEIAPAHEGRTDSRRERFRHR